MMNEALWMGLGVFITALGGVAYKLLLGYSEQSRKVRADTVAEWKEITDTLQKQLDAKTAEINGLYAANAQLRADVRLLETMLRGLQERQATQIAQGPVVAQAIEKAADKVSEKISQVTQSNTM